MILIAFILSAICIVELLLHNLPDAFITKFAVTSIITIGFLVFNTMF